MITILLTTILGMVENNASAHDITVFNDDGVPIYYKWINNNTELAVTFQGTSVSASSNSFYSGIVNIPETVIYQGNSYSVTCIGNSAFYRCKTLKSVSIPNSVRSFEQYAFYGCSITSIIVPNSVTSIGSYAFCDCSNLTDVTIPNSVTNIGSRAFSSCSNLMDVTIPNSVTSINGYVFSGCRSLTSITIPNSVTCIRNYAFYNCSGLTSITISNSVTSIEDHAFDGCSSLTSITIPDSVMSIKDYAFMNCSSLTTITIGKGVETICSQAFAKCPILSDVFCYAENVPSTNTDAFNESNIGYAFLYVPTASIDAYNSIAPWSGFRKIFELSDEEIPETLKCDKPNIIKEGNKFWFECGTPGATFKSKLIPNIEEQEFEGSEVAFIGATITYTLTVIASAEGYEDSDPVNISLTLEKCDVNQDGKVDVADIATIIDKMAGK